jgi:hypothetical protein
VRPVLAENCFKCHGEAKQKGGLRLDSRGAVLAGGDSGPAIEPGKPGESLLIEAIRHESIEMPPTGKLPEGEIAALVQWVEIGAPWPGASSARPAASAADGDPAARFSDEIAPGGPSSRSASRPRPTSKAKATPGRAARSTASCSGGCAPKG